MKTAIIGASGFIGRHLLTVCRQEHPDCVGTYFMREAPGLARFDLRDPDAAVLRLAETGHQAVIITSAMPQVDKCEKDPAGTRRLNVEGTIEASRQWARQGMKVVVYSSDYVFDGEAGNYDDRSPVSPINEYGKQKAALERGVLMSAPSALVVRLGKVFGTEKGDSTVLDDMALRLREGREVPAAFDQVFCPTAVEDLGRGIVRLLHRNTCGIVNFCVPEYWNRYNLAIIMAEALGADTKLVRRVSLADIPMQAVRPKNTTMICDRLHREVGMAFTSIGECVARVAQNWRTGGSL